ncbi:MAG: bifunctional hydroxymethylpyrimidine kinase/phosphomethylpyrimidine kinase [Desulfitobacteriaceae bacterium]|nr:bifunctional hydroxymethylpyrimidine kinase/phosphomethylpyrimidine kinase [Desulfitobacteriaceae bacterium]MDD4752552.1 bifunctional hydroxymethylpyrimidine kinase/phosphomethylpyrimidine kinase [Desulfitobacteriaceae bacterium]
MKKVLTIAGSDCSGGAGIQADIKTITAHKIYAMSVITALTAQNTTGVYGVVETDVEFVGKQIDCVMTDIFPDAIKIGMVSSTEIICKIVDKLKEYHAENVVVDPVMVSTSGSKLLSDSAVNALVTKLLPVASVITPNIPEAECLCGFKINTRDDMVKSAAKIGENYEGYILIKGGHLTDTADDLLYHHGNVTWFDCPKINNKNTHGTGCTLSSAIACNIAGGYSIKESVKKAKSYITCALNADLDLGKGSGPLNHCCNL